MNTSTTTGGRSRPTDNPQCPRCGGRTEKAGKRQGHQRYLCATCYHYFQDGYSRRPTPPKPTVTPGRCPYCPGRTHKRGVSNSKQVYRCLLCNRKCSGLLQPQRTPATPPTIAVTPGKCPRCGGHAHKNGIKRDRQVYKCTICRRHSRGPIQPVDGATRTCPFTNPWCVVCRRAMKKAGKNVHGVQEYLCGKCRAYYRDGRRLIGEVTGGRPGEPSNPWCAKCRRPMGKTGKRGASPQLYRCARCKAQCAAYGKPRKRKQARQRDAARLQAAPLVRCPSCPGRTIKYGAMNGKQRYRCTLCHRYCYGPLQPKARPTHWKTKRTWARRAQQMGDELLSVIAPVVIAKAPPDLHDDLIQEIALAALEGNVDPLNVAASLATYRSRINRLSSDTKKFVPIDSTVPGTNRLTYADVLVG